MAQCSCQSMTRRQVTIAIERPILCTVPEVTTGAVRADIEILIVREVVSQETASLIRWDHALVGEDS